MSDSLLSQAEIDALLRKGGEEQAKASVVVSERPAQAAPLGGQRLTPPVGHPRLGRILEIPLRLTVVLGETSKAVSDVVALAPGAIVEFERAVNEPVDIAINGKIIARGEVVVVDEHFGIRITQILSPQERVRNMA